MSCFGCFKGKSPDKEDTDDAQVAAIHPKANNGSQSPAAAVAATHPVAKLPSFVEKPRAPEPEPTKEPAPESKPEPELEPESEPAKNETPLVDRWQEAFTSLPDDTQKILKEMGFNEAKSANATSSISDLITAVNQKQEECEGKFWKVKIGGKDIVFRDYTTNIVGWLEKAGDVAIHFAPPQASLPWDMIKSLMKIPVNESEQMAALLATAETIVRITSRGQVYEQVYLPTKPGVEMQSIQEQLEGALLKVYSSSLELLADSGKLLDSGTARRTLEAIVNPGQFQGQLAGLKEDEEELLRDVQACEAQRSSHADNTMIGMLETFTDPIFRIDESVAHLLVHMDEYERMNMLEWISPVPFGKHHDAIRDDRTPGTGEWLLNHEAFRSWENAKSSLLFWLQGSPGTGKTYLTSTVIDRIQSQVATKNEGFAFFYCRNGDELRSQPLSILQSFVRQLSTNVQNPESVQTKLRDAVRQARDKGTNFRLQQCREQILASLNIYARSTLVIDALDECDPDSRYELIEALNSLLSNAKMPVKIFISSRPDPDLGTELARSHSVGIEAGDNQDDIRKYLDIELDKQAKKVAVLKRMKDGIMDKLLERSQGMFQWAVLQVHQLTKCRSAPSILDRLNKLPASLKDSYDEVWDQINSLEENDRILATRALGWAMVAFKPLTTLEMLTAIRMDLDGRIAPAEEGLDQNGLLSLCNGFLTVDNQLQVWRFPHLSVQEYLESENHVSISQAHLNAATTSLSYFINHYGEANPDPEGADNFACMDRDDYEYKGPDDFDDEKPMPLETDDGFSQMHPFHVYMKQCWVRHVHRLTEADAAELSPLLKTFLGSPDESSVQYQRWYQQTAEDCHNFWSTEELQYYDKRHFGKESFGDLVNELDPEDAAVFAMCRFSFDSVLSDWWDVAEIDVSRVNKRGHNLLMLAARAGSPQICEWLVNQGMDVNSRCQSREHGTALVAAASSGHAAVVRCLVEAGADVNVLLWPGEGIYANALEAAIRSGNVETARYLIHEADANIYIPLPGSSYGCALGAAAMHPGTEMLKLLVDAGADVDARIHSLWGDSALEIKIGENELDSVKYLVREAEANVNMPLTETFGTALEAAAWRGYPDIADYLVKEGGADVNGQPMLGYGGPLAAAAMSSLEIVKLLVESGADVNQPLLVGESASVLELACVKGCTTTISYLLSAGADPNMPLTRGRFGSALAAAAFCAWDVDPVRALVKAGADINMQLEQGEFGCALAAAGASNERSFSEGNSVFSYLVDAGADINMPLKHGVFGSPFAATVWGREVDRVKLLVDKGVDINIPLEDNDFCNPLAMAAGFTWRRTDFTFNYLLKIGVDVNPKRPGKRYGSPLIAAAVFGQEEHMKSLIEGGADVNAKFENSYYATALQAAQAPFEPEDEKWMERFFRGRVDDLENYLAQQVAGLAGAKPAVVELLLKAGANV